MAYNGDKKVTELTETPDAVGANDEFVVWKEGEDVAKKVKRKNTGLLSTGDVQRSVVVDSGKAQLSGDVDSPGNSKYYGTNGSGTRGFFNLPSGGSDGRRNALIFS